jgi:hypothetical protein
MWEFEKRHKALPDTSESQVQDLKSIAQDIWGKLGINPRGIKSMDDSVIEYVQYSPCQP